MTTITTPPPPPSDVPVSAEAPRAVGEPAGGEGAPQGTTFPLYLVNLTDHVVVGVFINGEYRPTNRVGRTCRKSDKWDCYWTKQYKELLQLPCGGTELKITLCWQEGGAWKYRAQLPFTPFCPSSDGWAVFLTNGA